MWWMTRESQAASAEASASGSALASPSSTWMAGVRGICSRIAADGSTATTVMSNQSLNAEANAPVPAPMSTRVIPGDGRRWRRTASRHSESPSRGTSRTALKAAAVCSS